MKRNHARKGVTLGILLLLLGGSVIPSTAQDAEKTIVPTTRGDWLFVGGSGPGNYSTIQDAINDSSEGDTIYVFAGIYHEAITVDVGLLTILGEGRDDTIIDANWTDVAVLIEKSLVTIHGFSIIGNDSGIYVQGELLSITISDNNLTQNHRGIEFEYDRDNYDNVIENNMFYSNHCGVYLLSDRCFNTIQNNTFIDNLHGMEISGNNIRIRNNTFVNCLGSGLFLYGGPSLVENNMFTNNNRGLYCGGSEQTITGNLFFGNRLGLSTDGSDQIITGNLFQNNLHGVRIDSSTTKLSQNNFIQNDKHASFAENNRSHGNIWDHNYWSNSSRLFGWVFIFGMMQTTIKKLVQFDPYSTNYYWIPWINLDRDPAQEPHDIG